MVECQIKGANSTILIDRRSLAPILKGPVILPTSSEFNATTVSIVEHIVPPAGSSSLPVIQTMIFVSKSTTDGVGGLLTMYEMLDRQLEEGEVLSHIGVVQIGHDQDVTREIFNSGEKGTLNIGVGRKGDSSKRYIVVHREGQERSKVFGSCNYKQQPNPETGECIDNPPDHFYLGLPLGLGEHSSRLLTCDSPCTDPTNSTCSKLQALCYEPFALSVYFWYLLMVALCLMCILCGCSLYFYRKLKQAQAEAMLMQMEARDIAEAQAASEGDRRNEEERANQRREQKETLERIKKLIRKNLEKIELKDLIAMRQQVGDTEEPSCGICIEEFKEETALPEDGEKEKQASTDLEIVKPPQCGHYYHRACILQWVDTNVDKMIRPDCPNCREPFGPTKPKEKNDHKNNAAVPEANDENIQNDD